MRANNEAARCLSALLMDRMSAKPVLGREIMQRLSKLLRTRLLGINPREVNFGYRGFSTRHSNRVIHLEDIGRTFIAGYQIALDEPAPSVVAERIGDEIGDVQQGFAFEGAGMALTLLDLLSPWRRDRLINLVDGPGCHHIYMVYIGAGWALARLRLRPERTLRELDPLLRWLLLDGYGFHEGYFHPQRSIGVMLVPDRLLGYARAAFDTGLVRSLWFVNCADPLDVANCIEGFAAERHANLWAGAGLACAYAGACAESDIEKLVMLAGDKRGYLAQGAAFAAKARQRAGNAAPHTNRAVQIICNASARQAADVCDTALQFLPGEQSVTGENPGDKSINQGVRLVKSRGQTR